MIHKTENGWKTETGIPLGNAKSEILRFLLSVGVIYLTALFMTEIILDCARLHKSAKAYTIYIE